MATRIEESFLPRSALEGRLVHGHFLRGVTDPQPLPRNAAQMLFDPLPVPDQDQVDVRIVRQKAERRGDDDA